MHGAVLFSPQLSRLDTAQVLTRCLLLFPPFFDAAIFSLLSTAYFFMRGIEELKIILIFTAVVSYSVEASAKCARCLISSSFIKAEMGYICIRLVSGVTVVDLDCKHEWGCDHVGIHLNSVQPEVDLTSYFKSRSSVSSVLRIIEPLIHSKTRQIYVELCSKQQHRCGDGRVFCIQ